MDCFKLPAGRRALGFLAGVTSFDVLDSENEAVLVVAGVYYRKIKKRNQHSDL